MTNRARAHAALWLIFAFTIAALFTVTRADAARGIGPETPASYARMQAAATTVNYGSGAWGGPAAGVTRIGDPLVTDVLIVGDSITNRCYPALRTLLAAKGKTLSVIAQSGQNIAGLMDLMDHEPYVSPTVIFAGGTNNVFGPPAAAAQVRRAVTWLDTPGMHWFMVDTYAGRAATAVDDARNSGQVNGYIHGLAGEDHVISWAGALTAARGRGIASGYYVQDGVHPWTTAGVGHGGGCGLWADSIVKGAKL